MRSDDLIESTISVPRHEAERLLVVATGLSRSNLLIGVEVSDANIDLYRELIVRREADEPLQYIEGSVPFGPIEVTVDPRVLIPRPETEYMFELIVRHIDEPSIIVDLCTGSGNLAIALKRTFPDAAVYATDLSSDAAAVARLNAGRNGANVLVFEGDLFSPLPAELRGSIDLLVANPPYLAEVELEQVPADVRMEPHQALVAGTRGDEIVSAIADQLERWLSSDGLFAVEVSEFHATSVLEKFQHLDAVTVADLTGRDRFVMSRALVD
jgi:release factor glutamine methyltransferase